ncbi:Ppx/GppA family phosphatase [Robertmurraya sp. DFI.2.37]|uniref:Ppx/GppA family phosphatase n=1 Tax=Robertmurraya sp. DFI.2.37 TaxID=3031819 RepID=UPI001CD9AB81|nr:Ppx/GppA family phosphatase [Robertmurraya sp. DFI.2.37]MDF1509803.1 Ppx/GppA family phosphatase [Robertmurraya sp. DFI.2.37]
MKNKVVALIDMGSNSIRLAIYQIDNVGHYKEIQKEKVAARLINYMENGKLTKEGIELVISTLKDFQTAMDAMEIDELTGFATAAIRQSSNQAEILNEIKKQTGISMKVLSEYEEAYYGYLGVIDSIDLKDGITIDIGGGSTEITLFHKRKLVEFFSFPFGAVSLNSKFAFGEQVTTKQLGELRTFLLSQFQKLPWLANINYPIIGIGGTARNLGRIYQKGQHTNEHSLTFDDINKILLELSSLSVEERSKIKGLSKKRKDIIIPGIMTFLTLMEVVQTPYFIFSEKSIRDGILKEKLTASSKQQNII